MVVRHGRRTLPAARSGPAAGSPLSTPADEPDPGWADPSFNNLLQLRRAETDTDHADLTPRVTAPEQASLMRRVRRLVWGEQSYRHDVPR